MRLSRLSTPRFDDVTCVKIDPSSVKVIISILCGPLNLVLGLHVFSIIGANMTTEFTMKNQIRIIHVFNDPFNHFYRWDDWESPCDHVYPRLLDIYVYFQVLQYLGNCFCMKLSLILFHVTSIDLSMKHSVFLYMGMVGFVTPTTSLVLASEASLEATLHVVGSMTPIDDERVKILVAQTLVCGNTLMVTRLYL